MQTFKRPQCYGCKFFKSEPKSIGGKAICSAYPNGIPNRIFFDAGNCSKKSNTTTRKKK